MKRLTLTAGLVLAVVLPGTAQALSHREAVAYGRAFAHVEHALGHGTAGCKLIGQHASCRHEHRQHGPPVDRHAAPHARPGATAGRALRHGIRSPRQQRRARRPATPAAAAPVECQRVPLSPGPTTRQARTTRTPRAPPAATRSCHRRPPGTAAISAPRQARMRALRRSTPTRAQAPGSGAADDRAPRSRSPRSSPAQPHAAPQELLEHVQRADDQARDRRCLRGHQGRLTP